MQKSYIVALSLAVTILTSTQAATVNWGSQNTNSLGLADGTTLAAQGSLVRVGYFTISNSQIQTFAAAGDKINLNAGFQEWGTSTVGNGYSLDGVWTQQTIVANASFDLKQMYYWTYDAPTLAAATQWGVYTAPSNPSWLFPSDSPTPGTVFTDLNQVPQNSTGLIVGSFGGGPDSNFGTPIYKMASISPVPEPTTFTAGALLALAAIGVRRRRRG